MILTPVHQFEIRFTTIINFSSVVRSVAAPFVKLARRVLVENENLLSEKITLIFDDEFYHVSIFSDRIIFRCERFDNSTLINNNSFIEEPFFNLFNKICQLPEFGNVISVLYFTFFVRTELNQSLENIKQNFLKENFNSDSCTSIISGLSDVAITLEAKEEDESVLSLTIGPYVGLEDIEKRKFNITDQRLLMELENVGEIIEFKYFKLTSRANFSLYKELTKKANSIIQSKWDK